MKTNTISLRWLTCFLSAATGLSAHAASVEAEIPAAAITVKASSEFSPAQAAVHLVDESGMQNGLHDNAESAETMWHSKEQPAPTSAAPDLAPSPAWVRFDFSQPEAITGVRIWNHNQAGLTDRGFKTATVYTSPDGVTWTSGQDIEIPRAPGTAHQPYSLALKWDGKPIKSVVIAAKSNYGSSVYGLSAVHFLAYMDVATQFPADLGYQPQVFYRRRPDGKPGREIHLDFKGGRIYAPFEVETDVTGGGKETINEPANPAGATGVTVLLPAGVSVDTDAQVYFTVRSGLSSVRCKFLIPRQRQWTVYVYPHSHVDIGYTNTQENVEIIHKRNVEYGIDLARKTANYPEGSRYLWNSEVAWPVERYMRTATEEQRANVLDAMRKGYLHVNAGYVNANTSAMADEEFDEFFAPAQRLAKLAGVKIDTMVQTDVPGMSWGIVPAAAQAGVRYCMALNNGSGRVGMSMELSYHPFWWIGPDGKTKVLFLEPGSYAVGARLKGMSFAIAMMGQPDPAKLPRFMKTNNPRAHFVDAWLPATLTSLQKSSYYPYDIFAFSWSIADNTPIDADLPDAVKSWNEDYAYPHMIIASAHEIMAAFDEKYGNQLPCYRGDFTEYWTDGLGSAAKQTSMNRNSKERLIQADTLWSMLRRRQPAPRDDFDEAWRYVVMGSEHTWCYSDPWKQPLQDEIKKVKFSYFQQAEDRSKALLATALEPAAGTDGGLVNVTNTLDWTRTGLVTLDKAVPGLTDESGRAVPVQKLSSGETVFLATEVPGLGSKTYRISDQAANQPDFRATGTTLDNGLVKVTLDSQSGDIVSLVEAGQEFASTNALCRLNSYRYLNGGDPPEKAIGPTDVKISIKENGPVVASLLVTSKAEGCNWLTREVRLLAGQPQVEIIDTMDKIARTAKEGVHFGFAFDVPMPRTHMDIPWGVAEVEADQLPEGNRNWIAFQRWLDISGTGKGVTWCSLDAPTFEQGNITANIMGADGAWIRHLDPSATIYSWALNNHWFTNFPLSQEGIIQYRYRILPHGSGYDPAAANRFGMSQARPLLAVASTQGEGAAAPVAIDNPRIVVSNLKTSADGKSMIVRLRSLSGTAETVSLTWPAGSPKALHYRGENDEAGGDAPNPIEIPPWGVIALKADFE